MSIVSSEYTAALVDGEGWIGFAKHPLKTARLGYNFQPMTTISMRKNDDALQYIATKYGGYFYPNVRRPSSVKRNYSPISILVIQWRKVKPFLQDILPFLHAKREQAVTMLKYFEEAFPKKRGQNGRFLGDEWLLKKVWYYNKLRELNARGKSKPPQLIALPRPAKTTRSPKWKPIFSEEELQQAYVISALTDVQIAQSKGCSRSSVYNYRQRHGIKARTQSQIANQRKRQPNGTFV